jgi:nucleotide-binding universal stress UspA family protein
MIKRILLGLGGTPFTDVAIERAVELAKIHGDLITGVTVVDTVLNAIQQSDRPLFLVQ